MNIGAFFMRTLIIENQYFPSILFYSMVLRFERVELEAQEHFQKKSFRNRMQLPGPNGIQELSIPLQSGKTSISMKDVAISYEQDWRKNHWNTVENIYKNSPYFIHYRDGLETLFASKYFSLWEFQLAIHNWVFKTLKVDKVLDRTKEYIKSYDENHFADARDVISPKGIGLEDFKHGKYMQVFEDRTGFLPNMSILDLLLNEGPNSVQYL